jgi:hypothetical protein
MGCALMSFPRARSLSEFAREQLERELILLDLIESEYHTLSNKAPEIWLAANGQRSVADIAEMVYGDRAPASLLLTRIGLRELADAGLLTEGKPALAVMNRRRAAQLAAAAVLGLVGLPIVTSITVPDSAAADSHLTKLPTEAECVAGDSLRCETTCCCQRQGAPAFCYDKSTCTGSGLVCI